VHGLPGPATDRGVRTDPPDPGWPLRPLSGLSECPSSGAVLVQRRHPGAERARARRNKRLQKGRPAAASAAHAAAGTSGEPPEEPEDEGESRATRSSPETPSVVRARDAGRP
jgi:hypothetical protein